MDKSEFAEFNREQMHKEMEVVDGPWRTYNRRQKDRRFDWFSALIGVLVAVLCLSALTIQWWWPQ